MKVTNFKLNPLRAAVIGAALMAANNVAMAAPVTKALDFVCPFPLIGDQTITATITADYPEELILDETGNAVLGEIFIDTISLIPDKARLGLSIVDATTITGTATSVNTFKTVVGDITNNAHLVLETTTIPTGESGPFDVPASGYAAAQAFDTSHTGTVSLAVDDLVLDLTNLKANGQVAPDPVGQFVADCALVPGQQNVLTSFEVRPDIIIPEVPADIEVDQAAVDFGTIQLGQQTSKTITITNAGELPLVISAMSIGGVDASFFSHDNNCSTIPGMSTCTVTVTYNASEEGTQNAVIVIESNDLDDPALEVALTGTGEVEVFPEIDVVQSIDFGTIEAGTSAVKVLTVNNIGGAALTVTGLDVAGSGFVKTADNCTTVAAGASCSAEITYTANEGASTGTVTISSDDADEPSSVVALSGVGEVIIVDPCELDPDSCVIDPCVEDPASCEVDPIGVELNYNVSGSSYIAANHGTIPLNGIITNNFDLASGTFVGNLLLDPTQGSFEIIKGWKTYLATAQIEFEPVGETVGTLIDGKLTAVSTAYVKLPKVTKTMFGWINWKIGGGENCRTVEPVTFTVTSLDGENFNPLLGGKVTGTYDMPAIENCGLLTSILSKKLEGAGNTIELDMAPILD
ncbi:choice-of-anchor D domain-containing protein [Alkalimarinus alittae]|uniref:Choice-of-anchor D domain-containing protein n=1 Tax=Alkalimarinus alittae TaxID=2961619 RepID=A0ABY6MZR6_9ALTE|nr:choice-of-anchor D domain-containing protein [Alkalimarinus alittae]UZE95341.1 choice-of-anchor D domain-containing protein [Alkalimarinus alittae]